MPPVSASLDPGDAQHGRLLRRADWRFLLPDPAPQSAALFAGGRLAQAAGLVSPQVFQAGEAPDRFCDLAIAVNPSPGTLQSAWQALRPGGALYVEWRSPLAGRPPLGRVHNLNRRLEAAGFREVHLYWAWPSPDRAPALFWLPLDAPAALQFYLSGRPPARSARERLLRPLLAAGWGAARRLSLLAPLSVTARKPGDEGPERAGLDLHAQVLSGWEPWGLGVRPGRLDWLLRTGGSSPLNKAVLLAFDGSSPGTVRPGMAVKLARVPESVPALQREAGALRAVEARRPGLAGVPRLLFCHTWERGVALGQTALAGQPVFTRLRLDGSRTLALRVTRWLAELAGSPPPVPRAAWWDRLAVPALDGFERLFAPVISPADRLEARRLLDGLEGLPLVPEQRDCSPWNLMVGKAGEIIALDWESAEPDGLPGLDLIYFLAYLAFFEDGAMENGRFRASYAGLLNGATPLGQLAAECWELYAGRVGISPEAFRPLALLAWMIHSRSEAPRLEAEAAVSGAEALRRSLYLTLWEETLRSTGCGR